MVRPPVRFRPAARRAFGGDLVPVFFIGKSNNSVQEIWSGTGGELITIDILADVPRTLAPTASKGMLQLLKDPLIEFSSSPGDETRFYQERETISEISEVSVMSRHVISNVAYVLCLRTHRVKHEAFVQYQFWSLQGFEGRELAPGSPVLSLTRSEVLDAIYDVVVFALDLESEQLSSNSQIIYQYAATPTAFGTYYQLQYEATETRHPTPLVISTLLNATHPFKSCGAALWSLTPVDPAPTTTTQQNLDYRSLGYFTNQLSRNFNNLLGLNTVRAQRLISKALTVDGVDQVFELSDYQNTSASACALYEDIALAWADSYSSYAAAVVLDREDVFDDLDGLTAADQDLFLSTIYQPPSFIAPGTSTAGSTSAASYFMETDATSLLSFVDNQSVAVRYWIPD